MTLSGTALKAVLTLLGCLVVADIAGVAACSILDIALLRRWSTALPYTIWLVFGVFCGLHAYNLAGKWASPRIAGRDWSEQACARRVGTTILVTNVVVLALAVLLLNALFWTQSINADNYYVPDASAPCA